MLKPFSDIHFSIHSILVKKIAVAGLDLKKAFFHWICRGAAEEIENDAMMLVNKDIFLSNDVYNQLLEDEDQLPVDFFIGFKTTINTVHHGTIVDIDESTANLLFVLH